KCVNNAWGCAYRTFWLVRGKLQPATRFRFPPLDRDQATRHSHLVALQERCQHQVTFCVKGVITPPCGVPRSVGESRPSHQLPALSIVRIRRNTLPSATCWATNVSSFS